jgi:molecular chaperone GrpE
MSTHKPKDDSAKETEVGEEVPITFVDSTKATSSEEEGGAVSDEAAGADAGTDVNGAGPLGEAPEAEALETETPETEDSLAAAKQEAADYYDRLLRLSAEFENYKKRSSRELADFRKFANEQIIKDLLGVIDNLERALASAADQEGNADSIAEGVELTLKEILKILEKNGVTAIAAEGEAFDPTYHQAVMQQETPDQPPNTVIQELQKGYLLHNRLLRPSMVAVSKTGGASE